MPGARRGAGLSARAALVVPLALVAALFIPPGARPSPPTSGARALRDRDAVPVRAGGRAGRTATRQLELNEGQAIHSLWRPGHGADRRLLGRLPGAAVRDRLRAPAGADRRARHGGRDRARARTRSTSRTRGSTPSTSTRSCSRSGAATSGCEARPQLREFAEDARPFLRQTDERYDAIFVDAYRQPYIPFYLTTREFFELVPRPAEPRRLGDHQHRPPERLAGARAGAERDDGRGVRARRPRPDPAR